MHNYAFAEKRLCAILRVFEGEERAFYRVEEKTALKGVQAVLATTVMLNRSVTMVETKARCVIHFYCG
ncbi:hypothetical protein [Xenorhabdus cabanillasii]|uniref:hypothetical protein n=1 Tax=Xenorhabdus cabanillasii TaxID=351673 RepID=UPI0004ACAF9D|nr:hypothetical protein [Xenorhabdus cabanillasii]